MSNRTLIIAEAGVNHNGELELAKKLVDAASDAGADFVKFQTFKADKLVSKNAQKAAYQLRNTDSADTSQYTMLKKLEMPKDWHFILKEYASSKGIAFLSTGFDEESIDFLDTLGLPLFKIPSGEITNKPYIVHVASKKKPVILSTGMADINEISDAIQVLEWGGVNRKDITVLHCNTEYPTPMEDVNLRAMRHIQDHFGIKIGYSDHTLGIEIPIAAVALGATVIEKHFTIDTTLPGPDHKASLEPADLKAMIKAIRNIELAAGDGIKRPSPSEAKNKELARKSIVASVYIAKGELLTAHNLSTKRPGNGISPMRWDELIGKPATRDYLPDESIEE